jgi:hypothetical protein
LELECDEPLSNFAFNFNLRRYSMAAHWSVMAVLLARRHSFSKSDVRLAGLTPEQRALWMFTLGLCGALSGLCGLACLMLSRSGPRVPTLLFNIAHKVGRCRLTQWNPR